MNEILYKFDQKFAAAHGTAEISAEEWFVIREHIMYLRKEFDRLSWQLSEQD